MCILFKPAMPAPKEKYPDTKARDKKYPGTFGIGGSHQAAAGNAEGQYKINEGFHHQLIS
jgi:surface antigen